VSEGDMCAGFCEYESVLVSRPVTRQLSERHHGAWLTRPPSVPHSPSAQLTHVCRYVSVFVSVSVYALLSPPILAGDIVIAPLVSLSVNTVTQKVTGGKETKGR